MAPDPFPGVAPSRSVAPASMLLLLCTTACDSTGTSSNRHLDDVDELAPIEEARLGDFDDPELGFSRVVAADVDEDGALWVVEASGPEIRRYAADGSVEARIGGRGEGPGEFMGVQRFGVQGDTVWAIDPFLQRITLFARDGSLLSTGRPDGVTVPLPEGQGYVFPDRMLPDGRFTGYMNRVAYQRDAPATGVRPTDSIPVPMVLFDPSGAVTDTIGWAGRPPPRLWRPPSEEVSEPGSIEVGGRTIRVPTPPTTLPHWLPTPDGYVLVETPRAETPDPHPIHVTRIGLAGDTVYSRALPYAPVAYAEAELDSIAARAGRGETGPRAAGAGDPEVPPDWQRAARRIRTEMGFPAYKLPIEGAWLAQDESIWLQRTPPSAAETPETVRWVILDPEGQPHGEVALPNGTRPLWHREDVVWVVEPDEYEVPWVVRYRLDGG